MALTCDQCGAPLSPKGDEWRIRCTYCGSVTEQDRPEPTEHDDASDKTPRPTEEVEVPRFLEERIEALVSGRNTA